MCLALVGVVSSIQRSSSQRSNSLTFHLPDACSTLQPTHLDLFGHKCLIASTMGQDVDPDLEMVRAAMMVYNTWLLNVRLITNETQEELGIGRKDTLYVPFHRS